MRSMSIKPTVITPDSIKLPSSIKLDVTNSGLIKLGLALAAVVMLSGCVVAPSKPQSFASLGQFEQYQLNTAIYRIRFSGNPDMSPATAEEISLLKAAKTTLDAGYRYFTVLDQSKSAPSRRAVVYPDHLAGPNWYGPYGPRSRWPYPRHGWGWNDPFYEGVVYNLDPVEVSYTIKCSNTASQKGEEFDARLIMTTLGPKYYLNTDGSPRIIVQPAAKSG